MDVEPGEPADVDVPGAAPDDDVSVATDDADDDDDPAVDVGAAAAVAAVCKVDAQQPATTDNVRSETV